jgi:fused signal recognition particle receptor
VRRIGIVLLYDALDLAQLLHQVRLRVQALQFHEAIGLTGIAITKLDGTAKGGILLAIARRLALPVRFIGIGEAVEDLQPFDAQAFAEALIGE